MHITWPLWGDFPSRPAGWVCPGALVAAPGEWSELSPKAWDAGPRGHATRNLHYIYVCISKGNQDTQTKRRVIRTRTAADISDIYSLLSQNVRYKPRHVLLFEDRQRYKADYSRNRLRDYILEYSNDFAVNSSRMICGTTLFCFPTREFVLWGTTVLVSASLPWAPARHCCGLPTLFSQRYIYRNSVLQCCCRYMCS